MRKIWKILPLLTVAAVLSACGGGGGSSGNPSAEYQITLRADRVQLPINIDHKAPGFDGYTGFGVYSPYTTVLHVNASVGGAPIPGGKDIFACNFASGLKDSSLYYLDGSPEHTIEVDVGGGEKIKVPAAYRNITLGSNAGGNTFHFHAGDEAGTARIVCDVMDPRDRTQKSAYVDITVGGATGKPASIRLEAAIPYYLGTRSNSNGLLNQIGLQGFVLDDNNQPATSIGAANVQVSILPGTEAADSGARLVAGAQSGSVLQLPSIGGVAQFSLLSGTETGTIFLQMVADRADNNVSNGIQDPMITVQRVPVIEDLTYRLVLGDVDFGDVTNTVPFTWLLNAQNGLPPYTWTVTGLPSGLGIDAATGLISGTPNDAEREYRAKVTVTDKNKLKAEATVRLNLVGAIKQEDFAISACVNKGPNEACTIPPAYVKQNYAYAFSASVSGVTWEFAGLPAWLQGGSTGQLGVVSGAPETSNCGTSQFFVTAKKGATAVTRKIQMEVQDGMGEDNACPTN